MHFIVSITDFGQRSSILYSNFFFTSKQHGFSMKFSVFGIQLDFTRHSIMKRRRVDVELFLFVACRLFGCSYCSCESISYH